MWVAKQMGHADWGIIRKVCGKWIPQEISKADSISEKMGLNQHRIVPISPHEKVNV